MKNNMSKTVSLLCLGLFGLLSLSACSNAKKIIPKGEAKFPTGLDRTTTGEDIYAERESIFGKDGLSIFGGKKKNSGSDDGSSGIGINTHLWRASLDTLSFMPLASADPFGGVIITDWYSAPEKPDERFKVNVFILDKQLVSTGVEVKTFRQVKKSGQWFGADVADNLSGQLEDSILTRARQLRVAALDKK